MGVLPEVYAEQGCAGRKGDSLSLYVRELQSFGDAESRQLQEVGLGLAQGLHYLLTSLVSTSTARVNVLNVA